MRTLAALLSCTLLAGIATAQEKAKAEIGIPLLGITIRNQSGTSVTHIGIPAGLGPVAQPSIYVTIFASPSVMVEPQLGFVRLLSQGAPQTYADAAVQLGYLFTPPQHGSPYLAGASLISLPPSVPSTSPRRSDRERRWAGNSATASRWGVASPSG